MKYIAIDHGNVRIGLAVSDPSGTLVRPYKVLLHKSRKDDVVEIVKIADDMECDAIVVGLPLDSNGSIGPRARSVKRFVDELRKHTSKKVVTWDESGSSILAKKISIERGDSKKKRRGVPIDDQAAALILEEFLLNKNISELESNNEA